DGNIGAGAGAVKGVTYRRLRQHPGVEVAREPAADGCVVSGVDEVRTDLEGLNRQTAPAQGSHEGERHCGLTHAAVCAGDHQTGGQVMRLRASKRGGVNLPVTYRTRGLTLRARRRMEVIRFSSRRPGEWRSAPCASRRWKPITPSAGRQTT